MTSEQNKPECKLFDFLIQCKKCKSLECTMESFEDGSNKIKCPSCKSQQVLIEVD